MKKMDLEIINKDEFKDIRDTLQDLICCWECIDNKGNIKPIWEDNHLICSECKRTLALRILKYALFDKKGNKIGQAKLENIKDGYHAMWKLAQDKGLTEEEFDVKYIDTGKFLVQGDWV